MPNHITNVLRINAYKHRGAPEGLIDEVLSAIRTEGRPFDFNRIIPMPEELNVTSGSTGSSAQALSDDGAATSMLHWPWVREAGVTDLAGLRDLLRKRYTERKDKEPGCETLDDFAARLRSNVEKHGHTDWYGWSVDNWGTKWNAYSAIAGKVDDQEAWLHFETAWSSPTPVLDALAAKFPKINMRLIWCDEGDDQQHRVYWEDGKRDADE